MNSKAESESSALIKVYQIQTRDATFSYYFMKLWAKEKAYFSS